MNFFSSLNDKNKKILNVNGFEIYQSFKIRIKGWVKNFFSYLMTVKIKFSVTFSDILCH